jgi:peptide/nickel transport system ATP-binding protein
LDTAIILITHDLGVVADIADTVVVMYAGHKMEQAPVLELFERPRHPYTKGLLGTVPRTGLPGAARELVEIPGSVPLIRSAPTQCVFADRCAYRQDDCRAESPVIREIGDTAQVACRHPVAVVVRSYQPCTRGFRAVQAVPRAARRGRWCGARGRGRRPAHRGR